MGVSAIDIGMHTISISRSVTVHRSPLAAASFLDAAKSIGHSGQATKELTNTVADVDVVTVAALATMPSRTGALSISPWLWNSLCAESKWLALLLPKMVLQTCTKLCS